MAKKRPPSILRKEEPAAEPKSPIHSAVETIFRNDDNVREALAENLRPRGEASKAIADRAKAAFAGFGRSTHTVAERKRRNYVAPGEEVAKVTREVVAKGIETFRETASRRSMRIHVGDELNELITKTNDGSRAGTIALGDLLEYVAAKTNATPTLRNDATFTACQAELEAERRLAEIVGTTPDDADEGDGPKPPDKPPDTGELEAADLVREQVKVQMETTTSPEGRLLYSVETRANQKTAGESIDTFELRVGPADVTAYHDFNSLQIAFEHVWMEIFDGRLAALGEELYHEYVKLQQFAGVDGEPNRTVSTVDDLKQLMAEIKELSRLTNDSTPGELKGKGATGPSEAPPANTAAEVVEVVKTVLDPVGAITSKIGDKTVEAIVNPGGAVIDLISQLASGKQQLTWASFPGPLPVGNDLISVVIEENAVDPGIVEIVLTNSPVASWWKGIEFTELDPTGQVAISRFKISNDPRDRDVWDTTSYNRLPLYTPQVQYAVLEFSKAMSGLGFGAHHSFYVLGNLGAKMKDRTRVTFNWLQDQ